TGQDIGFLQARVLIEDVLDCPATRQAVQDERYPDAMPTNTRLAKADVGIDGDPGQQFGSGHGELPIWVPTGHQYLFNGYCTYISSQRASGPQPRHATTPA